MLLDVPSNLSTDGRATTVTTSLSWCSATRSELWDRGIRRSRRKGNFTDPRPRHLVLRSSQLLARPSSSIREPHQKGLRWTISDSRRKASWSYAVQARRFNHLSLLPLRRTHWLIWDHQTISARFELPTEGQANISNRSRDIDSGRPRRIVDNKSTWLLSSASCSPPTPTPLDRKVVVSIVTAPRPRKSPISLESKRVVRLACTCLPDLYQALGALHRAR